MSEPSFLVRIALGVGLARRTAPALRAQTINETPQVPAQESAPPLRRTQPSASAQALQSAQAGQAAHTAGRQPAATMPSRAESNAHAAPHAHAGATRPNPPAHHAPLKPTPQVSDGGPLRAAETDIGTVMPAAAQLNGDLDIEESIVLQCVVRGNVTQVGDHQVVLSSTGGIHGTLRAHTAVIGGTVEGDVFADRVVVLETGIVNGNIEYTTLAIKEGATVNGMLTRIVPNVVGAAEGAGAERVRIEQPGLRAVNGAGQERVA